MSNIDNFWKFLNSFSQTVKQRTCLWVLSLSNPFASDLTNCEVFLLLSVNLRVAPRNAIQRRSSWLPLYWHFTRLLGPVWVFQCDAVILFPKKTTEPGFEGLVKTPWGLWPWFFAGASAVSPSAAPGPRCRAQGGTRICWTLWFRGRQGCSKSRLLF